MTDENIDAKKFEEFERFLRENTQERMLVRAHIIERFIFIETI